MQASLYSVQELPTGKISILARPRGGDWLVDEVKAIREAGVDVVVSCLTSEEEVELGLREEAACCLQQGIIYWAFSIRDRGVPAFSSKTFRFLEQLHTYLSQGQHLALHCRQGLGRSVLMAACLLVLSNFSPDQAFDMLSRARGCPLPETEEQRAWVMAFASHSSLRRLGYKVRTSGDEPMQEQDVTFVVASIAHLGMDLVKEAYIGGRMVAMICRCDWDTAERGEWRVAFFPPEDGRRESEISWTALQKINQAFADFIESMKDVP